MTDTTREPAASPHPAAVLPDGADIRFVSFVRRLPDGSRKHAPVDFPVEDMVTWDQVVELWGGGEYQAIAKTHNHRVVGHYPTGGKWMAFAGDPKPMVKPPRAPRPVAVDDPCAPILPAGAVPPAPAAAHSEPPVARTAPPGSATSRPTRSSARRTSPAPAPARGPAAPPEPAAPGPAFSIRDVELGERAGLPNPFHIRPRIGRLIREGVLSEFTITPAADGAYLLSREAAVLITMRLKLKRRVQLEVVGALLVAAQQPHPVPLALAPDVPPARAAPPIVMNGEGATATFEGHTIPVHVFRDRACIIAGDLGRALGYADGRLAESVRDWREMESPRDFEVLDGDALRAFKALAALTPGLGVSRNAREVMVLSETGMDLACQKAQTEAGARLRRYLADHVLPKLRRGEPVTAGGTQVPLVSAMAPYTSGPARPSPVDTPKFHPVLVDRLDETSRRLAVVEDRGRQIEARLGDLEARLSGAPPSGPWLA